MNEEHPVQAGGDETDSVDDEITAVFAATTQASTESPSTDSAELDRRFHQWLTQHTVPARENAAERQERQTAADPVATTVRGQRRAKQNSAHGGSAFAAPTALASARDVPGPVDATRLEAGAEDHMPAPRQLPRPPWLVGRDDQVRWLDRMLRRPGAEESASTISVVSGMPGIGKSTLAVHWAHRVATRLPDGQLYADLRGYSDQPPEFSTDVLDRFMRSLGVPDNRIPPDLPDKQALYQSLLADRRVLVVLDNAATSEQVLPFLPGGSDCAVVITSRHQLAGIEGATYLTLGPVGHQDAIKLLRRVLRNRNAADAELGELAMACAHLPLALRIVAQRACQRPMVPLSALISDLRDPSARWHTLSMHGPEEDSVYSVFSWSYDALPRTTARFFRLLGLHPGPDIPLEAAAALAGLTLQNANAEMKVLVEAHLVEQPAPRRYALNDLIRAFARKRTELSETDQELDEAMTRLSNSIPHSAAPPARPHRC